MLPVILETAVPNALRDPRQFWHAATIARYADLTDELQELKARRLPVVVLGDLATSSSRERRSTPRARTSATPMSVTVDGSHSWLLADPDEFGEVITNVIPVAMTAAADEGRPIEEIADLHPNGRTNTA